MEVKPPPQRTTIPLAERLACLSVYCNMQIIVFATFMSDYRLL